MANPIIKIKRSAVAGKIPTTTSLELGELAINTYDGKLFIQQDQSGVGVGSTVITINPWNVGVGSAAYNTYFTAGSVGIGTTLPKAALNVVGVVSATSFVGDGSQLTGISASGGSSQWISNSAGIHTLGNVGVGTTNPTSKLTVSGNGLFTGVVTASSFFGSGINLTGIVTSIVAGSNITISGSTGQVTISSSGSSTKNVDTYTATEGQTTFSATYSVGYVDVYLNGIKLSQSQYTATNGTSIVLVDGASLDDVVEIVGFVTNASASTYATSAGIATYATIAGVSTYATSAGISTVAQGLTGTPNINVGIVTASQITGIGTISGTGAGYNDAVKFTNSSGTENGQLCKAWVNFNGTGTVAIRGSFNVSSITDNGIGNYTVNFANAFTDANYAYSHAYSNEVSGQHTIGFLSGYNSSTLNIEHYNAANSANRADKGHVFISVFR